MLLHALFTTAFLAALALATGPAVSVAIETGSGSSLKNTTVSIPINAIYANNATLTKVAALYLTGASGISVDSVTCIPFSDKDGAGTKLGRTFSLKVPSYLTTNDIDVGSIVCTSSAISQAPPGGAGGASSSIVASTQPSTTLTTHIPVHTSVAHTTSKSVTSATSSAATATASASQSAGNAANGLYLSGELFGGLALAGFGLAFAL